MSDSSTAPILFLIFNRADLTQRVFERIREARPRKLFIAADGPRASRPNEQQHCADVRLAVSGIDWPCEVHRLYRDANLGCKMAVSSAISWFFEHVEAGIILEDDCLPDPSFFPYCAELLERYRDEPTVAMIGASQLLPTKHQPARERSSYYFTKYPHIWGWATWRRTWQNYDSTLTAWDGNSNRLDRIANSRVRRRFARKFDAVKAGLNDTWDYQLVHQCLVSGALSIIPNINLVENIGFDERATHTLDPAPPGLVLEAGQMAFPMAHPNEFVVDEKADIQTERRVYRVSTNLWVSLQWSLEKRLGRLFPGLRCAKGLPK